MGILSFLGGGVVKSIGGIVKSVVGDKSAREQQASTEQMAVLAQFAAESQPRENRTWWDALVDGLNRLPRPLMTFGVMGLFVWAVVDPAEFALSMNVLQIVPEMLWYLFMTIVTFWFGGKLMAGAPRKSTAVDPAVVASVMKTLDDQRPKPVVEKAVADEETPMSNASIEEWNQRNR